MLDFPTPGGPESTTPGMRLFLAAYTTWSRSAGNESRCANAASASLSSQPLGAGPSIAKGLNTPLASPSTASA